MRAYLKSFAIVLSLAAAVLASATAAGAGSDRHGPAVLVGSGRIVAGYRDGYWDLGHRWHRWNDSRDTRNYRNGHAGNYRDWDHATVTVVEVGPIGRGSADVGGVAYAYRDGFWDRMHRWHRWNGEREHRDYRRLAADNYRNWNHDRDGGDGWRRD